MTWIITKYLLTAGMVVFISEVAKRSDRLGGFIAALPLMTFLTLVWLYVENQTEEKIANHAYYTFWYVIPTLPMFLLFPYLLPKLGFWATMGASTVVTVLCFGLFALVMKNFGVNLLCKKKNHPKVVLMHFGGPGRNRTTDTRIFSPLLYRLSYQAKS